MELVSCEVLVQRRRTGNVGDIIKMTRAQAEIYHAKSLVKLLGKEKKKDDKPTGKPADSTDGGSDTQS